MKIVHLVGLCTSLTGGSDGNTVMLALIVTAGLTLGVLSGLGLVHLWRRRTHARDGKGGKRMQILSTLPLDVGAHSRVRVDSVIKLNK